MNSHVAVVDCSTSSRSIFRRVLDAVLDGLDRRRLEVARDLQAADPALQRAGYRLYDGNGF